MSLEIRQASAKPSKTVIKESPENQDIKLEEHLSDHKIYELITKALIKLANSIGLNAIAEGIERKEHVEQLSRDGYIMGQGYYYSKPLKVKAFEEYMRAAHD